MDNKQQKEKQKIPDTVSQIEKLLKVIIGKSYDVVIERFKTSKDEALIVYVDGLVNKDLIDRDIINPLKSSSFSGNVVTAITSVVDDSDDMITAINRILDGFAVVFYNNEKTAYIVELRQWERRSVSIPDSENVIRGPKEGFTESILTNTALIRRKLKTPNLIFERMVIGRQSNTSVAIVYLEDIVNDQVLNQVRAKLKTIDVDAIFDTGQIEQYMEDHPYNLIPSMGVTQKPDKTAAKILEGRVAIICDGTPHVLIIPELFVETIHSTEEFYQRTLYANFLRLLRVFALALTILLPGFAAAVFTFHPEMVPLVFLNTVIAATVKTPLPITFELFFLIIMFQLLQEAGVRLPQQIGSAITIVGALIIGQAAVEAGIVGAPSVIIVALTALSGLLIPNLNEFYILYRLFFLILGGTMGLIGISMGIIIMLVNIISTQPYGIPSLATFRREEMKDNIIRAPLKKIFFRPETIVKNNIRRNSYGKSEQGDSND